MAGMLTLLETPVPFLTDQKLAYDPTGEWMFPSLLDTTDLIPGAPARWLLAYSPHDTPGGICFAWSDSLDGQWQEVANNPLIARDWAHNPHAQHCSHFYQVSHVASPHLIWLAEREEIACYFHGENDTTRVAYSKDGHEWHYGGVMLTANAIQGWNMDELSYARVFPFRLPDQPACRYVMLFMSKQPEPGASGNGTRHIFMAWSPDGRSWMPRSEPVITPPVNWQACSPQLIELEDGWWVLHHYDIMNGPGNLMATPVNAYLRRRGESRVLLSAESRPEADGRVADPFLVRDGDEQHLIWLEGARLQGRFARARVQLSVEEQEANAEQEATAEQEAQGYNIMV